jgi:SAM-dependent methyltransferase
MSVIDGRIKQSVAKLWHKFYPDYTPDRFACLVETHVGPSQHVLEIGAGSGEGLQKRFPLKGKVARYVGIDLDSRVLNNPYLDEAFVADAANLPFADASFDVVFHSMVAEHLEDPATAIRETARVLKPDGMFLFETPNRWYYPMLVAVLTPHWFHRFYVRGFGSGRKSEDVFPTVYRLNDSRSILSATAQAGLTTDIQFWSTPPGYLRFSVPSFLLGVLYERVVERLFPAFRSQISLSLTSRRPCGKGPPDEGREPRAGRQPIWRSGCGSRPTG